MVAVFCAYLTNVKVHGAFYVHFSSSEFPIFNSILVYTLSNSRTSSNQNIKDSASDISSTPKPSQILMKYQKLDIMEVKDLLLCFLHIIKYLPDGENPCPTAAQGIVCVLQIMVLVQLVYIHSEPFMQQGLFLCIAL